MKKLLCLLLVTLLAMSFPAAFAETPAESPAPVVSLTQSEMLVYAREPVNMREMADAKSDIIVELQTGEAVILKEVQGNWALVRRGLDVGYVFARYLTGPHETGRLYTALSRANVYAQMDTGSELLGRIEKGDMVMRHNGPTAYGAVESWAGIQYGEGAGYVRGDSFEPMTEVIQGYETGGAALVNMNFSEYFTKERADIFIAYFFDAAGNLAIRVLNDGSLAKLYEDVSKILGEETPFNIVLSSMPAGFNGAKIEEIDREIAENYKKLTVGQKARVPRNSWGYNAALDCYEIGMTSADEETFAAINELIGDIPGVTFS